MIINLKTQYVDEDGVLYTYKEIEEYHYKIKETEHGREHNKYKQDIRWTRHFVDIKGKKAKQQELF